MAHDTVFRFLFLISLFTLSLSSIPKTHNIFLPIQLHNDDSLSSSASSCPAPNPNLNYRPVIGILTHPGDGASGRLSNDTDASNIPASYVKFAESGGARVIPLVYNEPTEKLLKKLDLVNGVIFVGGWAKDGLYLETVARILKIALQRNDAGDHFPIYGICLGFELITMIISEDNDILDKYNARNQASTLQFVENANTEGSIFQSFPPDLIKKLSTECIVMQNHQFGISPEKLQGNEKLSSFWEILTISTDENNQVYVSTVRSRKYPVTGFQWHPEKNAFEWGSANIPHTENAIRVTQSAAGFLVSEARKSTNRPNDQEVRDNLIYNYTPTYGGKAGKGYDEVYIFK
ncbi:PREDICTED: gamma-glutamyl hydrolase 2-like isoform X2 [Lupinus angustifolius]|uniref:gamma-glutamyl hydrolase 2-like isoform X2 n=1 Tax=Lupinus angustifolius TaxID=3871 RepID=UPI00092E5E2B|nr:PREDICTED: gamma-glutamyl hydrolase 2-like isoform X2 [Lupinus angustifolius]